MALQSEAPPLGEAHIHGDQKSEDDTEVDEVDLEEGEILDSGAEAEDEVDIKPNLADLIKNSPKRSPNKSPKVPESAELSGMNTTTRPLSGSGSIKSEGKFDRLQNERYFKKFKEPNYIDHDHLSDGEENDADRKKWFERLHPKNSHDADEITDYRKELAAYRGDFSSPEPGEKSEKKKKRKSKSRKLSESKRKKALEKNRKRGKEMPHRIVRKPCKYWDEGHCNKGPQCPFQHNHKFQKKEICRYYISGCCRKIDVCPFMHGDFPCKFFHTGSKCYAGDKCRFSHEPLTEEKRKILHDYLKAHHGDDYHHDKPSRKREREKERTPVPEPPQKRVCLLGSPPRHIKEAEETKRWQEEMMHLHQEQNIDAFQIHFSNQMPPLNNRIKPKFYTDTLSSPVKSMPPNKGFGGMNNMPPSIMGCHINSVNDRFVQPPGNHIPKGLINWKNIRSLIDGIEAPQNNSENNEVANTEGGSFNTNMLYPNAPMANDTFGGDGDDGDNTAYEDDGTEDEGSGDFKPLKINQEVLNVDSSSPKESVDESSHVPVAELPDPDPIVIPNHLPRKQRELMMRIQKHQKLKSTTESDSLQIIEDKTESESDDEDIQVIENKDEKKMWDSSDDDDEDDPLTTVLQKLNQAPPPKPKELGPDISQMLTSIMQKANENRSGSVYQEQNQFWTDILSGTVPPGSSESASSMARPNQKNLVTEEGNSARRVLLPNPEAQPLDKPKADIRDPRLKNRDPRTAAAPINLNNSNNNIVKPEIPNTIPLPILPLDVSSGRHSVNPHHKDLNSLIPNQAPAAIVEGLQGTVPYRLQEVISKPLNYSSYIQASHSDPKLLNDPRLRRLLTQGSTLPSLTSTENFINSVPKPSSTLPDLPLFTNLVVEINPTPPNSKQDSTPVEMPSLPEIQLPELQPSQLSKISDPRTRRIEQRRSSENGVPPHLPVAEPHIPISTIPTFSKSSVVPTPASHLPRSMADPRMANLHNRLDPRRTWTRSDPSSKILKKPVLPISQSESQLPELKQPVLSVAQSESQSPVTQPELKKATLPIAESELQSSMEQENKDSKPDGAKVKSPEDKSKKNKAVHRNRKTSMDYASPLNSCDDSRSSDKLKYNSYTKRPRKPALNSTSQDSPAIEINPVLVPSNIGSPVIPEFIISDSSNVDSDSMDSSLASLKDVFKTKDPTASPFC